MNGKMKAAIAAAGIGLFASGAGAATVGLDYNGLNTTPAQTVRITSPITPVTVYAGGFKMNDGSNDFIAWCIDLYDTIKSAQYTDTRPAEVSNDDEADLNKLFTNNLTEALGSALGAAAFQVAIWEIVYEDGAIYNVGSGTFSMDNNADVSQKAGEWLANLGTSAGKYDLTFYTSENSQDLVTGDLPPVPLPAGMVLMVSALGLLGLRRRTT